MSFWFKPVSDTLVKGNLAKAKLVKCHCPNGLCIGEEKNKIATQNYESNAMLNEKWK